MATAPLSSSESNRSTHILGAEDNDAEVSELAKSLKERSGSDPFSASEDSSLDPDSKNFRAHDWVKAMLRHHETDDGVLGRTAGVAFRDLNVHGFGSLTDYQKDVGNVWLDLVGMAKWAVGLAKPRRIDILRDLEGVVRPGEMLLVLGPPGSGCTTFLKTMAGETYGFNVDDKSHVNYQGIPPEKMHKYFRGEAIYTAEVDEHIPILTVGDTLTFAARARTPKKIPDGMSRNEWAQHLRDVVMAAFGISHTKNTRVGDDFVRGVSGGERKRITIAEAALSGAPLQAWDNSTRGLDSANAIEFCKTLRLSANLANTTACVAIYQAPQAAFDQFDKALVLYEGRQIYFGPSTTAQGYFERLGFVCPERQTSADFLTSMTSPRERIVRDGFESKAPRTPDEFAARWRESSERTRLLQEIEQFNEEFPLEGESYNRFVESRRAHQAKLQRMKSPYTLSYGQQIGLCLWRGIQRVKSDPGVSVGMIVGCAIQGLILGSVFFQMPEDTSSFFQRGSIVYFALLLNAFGSVLEILTIYSQRRTVEKHARYALYHPSADAIASMLTELPLKVINSLVMSTIIYFMVRLRQTPGAFFFFWFICFILIVTTSMMFRCIGALSRTFPEAMVPAALLILTLVVFTGFAIPTPYMPGWCRWINYLDPVAYGFESLMVNEFYGREFPCSTFVPSYGDLSKRQQVCSAVGSTPGSSTVAGTAYIESAFQYYHSHKYRNIPIVFALAIFFCGAYLIATELVSSRKSKGEVLMFRRGHAPSVLAEKKGDDEAADHAAGGAKFSQDEQSKTEASDVIQRQTAVFTWRNVCYDIKIKKEERRILDHVDGWVKPGTLTALMGVSGAGKTTLLDVLATRVTMGVIHGDIAVNGQQRDSSFQRKTGYVQQQDLHLETATVREALNFSALLRQPLSTPRHEKLAYVDEVIKMLDMQEYAEAVVGVPGEGLNVEQRKRLTIGVELAAKPALLLFLDEPTSGLDSQTSWAILDLLEKLKKSGQAILCTIHQPNAMLFQRFDQLLFLAAGGKTVYFGGMGPQSRTVTSYFEANGAPACPPDANPAEWMLEVIGAAPGSHTSIDWFKTWRKSPEYVEVHKEIDHLMHVRPQTTANPIEEGPESYREFAAPLSTQIWEVTRRVFQQYWRSPSYIYAKAALCILAAIYVGFIFINSPLSQQGIQNQMFAIFAILALYPQLTEQILPHFMTQRALYEARERPSKAYSWKAFIFANIMVELPWNALMGVGMFFCFYYPVGLYHNATFTDAVTLRGAQFFLFLSLFPVYMGTFTQMVAAGMPDAESAANVANLLMALALIFCGILQTPTGLPGFWTFMYRASPYTYFVEGMLSTGVANAPVTCASNELLHFQPRLNETCGDYMKSYMSTNGGYVVNSAARSNCEFCIYRSTDDYLASVSVHYSHAWRDYGIVWAFIIFNIFAAFTIYWLARVPKKAQRVREEVAEVNGSNSVHTEKHGEEKL